MWSTIGFEKQKKYFANAIKSGQLSHAYIFSGPAMIGKKTFAQELCGQLNGRPWHSDYDTKFVGTGAEKAGITIEDIRGFKSFLSRTALQGPFKLVIVDNAHQMTQEAANAFLKTLEEPTAKTILFLVTDQPGQLLATIRSRCHQIQFLSHDKASVEELLKAKKLNAEDRDFLTLLADGRIGWVKMALESGKLAELKASIQDFQKALRQGVFERLQYAQAVAENESYPQIVDLWLRWARAHGKDPAKTAKVLHNLIELQNLLHQPQFNHRLAIENFLVNI